MKDIERKLAGEIIGIIEDRGRCFLSRIYIKPQPIPHNYLYIKTLSSILSIGNDI